MKEDAGLATDRLLQWRYRRPILLTLASFNQLIGINAVLYYLNDIFAMPRFSRASQNLQAVAVGTVMLVATLVLSASSTGSGGARYYSWAPLVLRCASPAWL